MLKLSTSCRVASDGGGWNENYSFVGWLRAAVEAKHCWQVLPLCWSAGGGRVIWWNIASINLTRVYIKQYLSVRWFPVGTDKTGKGSTGMSWWEVWKHYWSYWSIFVFSCGTAAADSSSICPNVVCLLGKFSFILYHVLPPSQFRLPIWDEEYKIISMNNIPFQTTCHKCYIILLTPSLKIGKMDITS